MIMKQYDKYNPYAAFFKIGDYTDDAVVLDATELAERAERELKSDRYDYIKIKCFNREEVEIFKRVFREKLSPNLFRRVIFTWLVFR